MKTNKSIKVKFNRHEKAVSKPTNDLDEILMQFSLDIINDLTLTEMNLGNKFKLIKEAKQQINKWALEKCLMVIGEKERGFVVIMGYVSTNWKAKVKNELIEEQKERARKEFE